VRFVFFALTVSVLSNAALAQAPVRAWQGNRTVVKAHHLVPAIKDGEGYGEKYTFNGEFGDRGSFYFSLAISNLGFGDRKMEAKGRLTIDGQSIRWKKKLDADEWSFTKAPFSIKAGPATLSGTPKRLVMTAAVGKQRVEAVMTPIARPWRPRNGRVLFGTERKVSDFTVFPLTQVEVKYNLGDGQEKTVSGRGHGTRSWSEIAVYEQSRSSLEFRGITDNKTIYIREIFPAREYAQNRVAYVLITKGSEILIESFDFELKPTDMYTDNAHPNQYRVPVSFDLVGKDAEDPNRLFRGRVTKKRLRSRDDILKSMNAVVRMVAKRYSQPVSYSYESDFLIQVKNGDQVDSLSGVGRYGVYHWKK